MSNIAIVRGDTAVLDVAITRSGSPVDLTGATLWFTAKRAKSDPDAVAVIAKSTASGITVTSASGGTATITIDPDDTSDLTSATALVFDVQLKESGGRITTVDSGTLRVTLDVTQATA